MPTQTKPKSIGPRWDSFCFFADAPNIYTPASKGSDSGCGMTSGARSVLRNIACQHCSVNLMYSQIMCVNGACQHTSFCFAKGFALRKTTSLYTKSYPLFLFSWPIRVSLSLCQTRQRKSIKLSSVLGSVVTGQAQLTDIHPLAFSFLSMN